MHTKERQTDKNKSVESENSIENQMLSATDDSALTEGKISQLKQRVNADEFEILSENSEMRAEAAKKLAKKMAEFESQLASISKEIK